MRYYLIVLLLTTSTVGISQTLTSQQTKSIDSLFVNWDSENKPGITVAIVRNGTDVYSKTFGMADVKAGTNINATTPMWIASVSKQFTAVGANLTGNGLICVSHKLNYKFNS